MIQNDVLADMEADGPSGIVKRQALRLSAASEMLWGHMQTGPKEFNACLEVVGLVGEFIHPGNARTGGTAEVHRP